MVNKANAVLARQEKEEAQEGWVRVQGVWPGTQEEAQALRAEEGQEARLAFVKLRSPRCVIVVGSIDSHPRQATRDPKGRAVNATRSAGENER